jgi:general secretion pathway protein D
VLAITPRIIGNITRPQAEIIEYWSGTETLISDKPQVTLPTSNGGQSNQEMMREKMRLRQQKLNSNQEIAPSEEPVTPQADEPASTEIPPVVEPIPNTIDENPNPVFGGSVTPTQSNPVVNDTIDLVAPPITP